MKVAINTEQASKNLQEYRAEIQRKLKNMVAGFTTDVVEIASGNTPIGNYEKFFKEYNRRTTLKPIPGFAKGSWIAASDLSQIFSEYYSTSEAVSQSYAFMQKYTLGQTYYIKNTGPYIGLLEGGSSKQAPEGIVTPTIADIQKIYASSLKRHFDM